jgi:hypothetical protein
MPTTLYRMKELDVHNHLLAGRSGDRAVLIRPEKG